LSVASLAQRAGDAPHLPPSAFGAGMTYTCSMVLLMAQRHIGLVDSLGPGQMTSFWPGQVARLERGTVYPCTGWFVLTQSRDYGGWFVLQRRLWSGVDEPVLCRGEGSGTTKCCSLSHILMVF